MTEDGENNDQQEEGESGEGLNSDSQMHQSINSSALQEAGAAAQRKRTTRTQDQYLINVELK